MESLAALSGTGNSLSASTPADLHVEFLSLPGGAFTLYDLESKKVRQTGKAASNERFAIPSTTHDHLLLIIDK